MSPMSLNKLDVAWAAGLFEGEGSCFLSLKPKNLAYARMSLSMQDEPIVRKFYEVVGVGRFRGPQPNRWGTAFRWTWYATRWIEVVTVVDLLAPYLGERRLLQMLNSLGNDTRREAFR